MKTLSNHNTQIKIINVDSESPVIENMNTVE